MPVVSVAFAGRKLHIHIDDPATSDVVVAPRVHGAETAIDTVILAAMIIDGESRSATYRKRVRHSRIDKILDGYKRKARVG